VKVGQDTLPFAPYNPETLIKDLSAQKKTYNLNFTMTKPTDLKAGLIFFTGGNDAEFCFDNISLKKH
jgi:hypothetical protein